MKITELRSKTVDELQEQLIQAKKESFNLRFQKATGELKNTSRIRKVRRLAAKLNTLLAENNKKSGV